MPSLTRTSETLYVPLLGRIYASRCHPNILHDAEALSIADRLPDDIRDMPGQTEYTLLASAVRSRCIDHYLQAFLRDHPQGVIVNVGCGLETTYYRNDNGTALWFELDLPEVLELRSAYFPAEERDRYLPYSMFDYAWLDVVAEAARHPAMVIASGLFYYFPEERVIDFARHLAGLAPTQLVFDAVSSAGMKGTRHYMRKMGRQDAAMYFSVDSARAFAAQVSADTTVIEERKLYSLVPARSGVGLATRAKMFGSDLFNMVKIIHLHLG
jgi:O-methyltransferase involved in polyketide biosynthesis